MKRLFIALSMLFGIVSAWAVPAKRGVWKTLRLADGTEIRAELHGDEHGHYWLTPDGTAYTEAEGTDLFHAISLDSLGQSRAERLQASNASRLRRAKASNRVGIPTHYTGKKKGLIILAQFPDKLFTGYTSEADASTIQQRYDRIANEEGFTSAEGFTGSIYDYFKAQSLGQFELTFDVVGPYTTDRRAKYYGQDVNGTQDYYLGSFIAEICQKADADVNFADYDWDGDGEADQLFILYAGQGQAAGGDANTIWPAEGKLSGVGSNQSPLTLDGVKVDTYACSCELGVNATIDGIGTICHEFAHCFGLPDMYDVQNDFGSTYRKYGMSYWDLMDLGNYNNDSFTPASFTAYERMFCGWQQPIVLSADTAVADMGALADGSRAYIIYNDAHADEYFLLENRQLRGWDAGLPAAGLLITHVDYNESMWQSNSVNSYAERCTVVRADNSDNRATNDLAEVAGDVYPHAGNNSLTNDSQPAATLRNANTDGSFLLNKSVTGITQNADGTIAFRFTNGVVSGIERTKANVSKAVSPIYTLGGQRTAQPQKGIYIKDGKKIKY